MILGCQDNEGLIVNQNNPHLQYARNWASTHNATYVSCEHIITGYAGSESYDICVVSKNNKTIRIVFFDRGSREPTSITQDPE